MNDHTPRENHSSNPTTSSALSLSVVVPTRNRPEHARECAASIIKNQSFVDLIVVDQSDGLETEREIATLSDPRIRYLRTPTRGVTSARNLGIEHSRSDIVAFTDDDCRVPQDWTDKIIQVFVDDPAAVVVCGRVKVPEELWQKGFTESFEPHQREWLRRYPPFGRDWGITANMSMRRQLVVELGCFDPMLGAGSPLRSGGEPDLIFRVLRAGLKVVNAAEIELDHLGVRPYGEAATKLMRGYGFGTGAAFFKHVRLGDAEAAALCMRFFAQNVSRIGHSLLHTARPTGLGYLIGFVSGAAASYKFGVDRKQRRYVRR